VLTQYPSPRNTIDPCATRPQHCPVRGRGRRPRSRRQYLCRGARRGRRVRNGTRVLARRGLAGFPRSGRGDHGGGAATQAVW
jgi:hypothetical protein